MERPVVKLNKTKTYSLTLFLKIFLTVLVCFIVRPGLFARDINLDSIYLKKTSGNYRKLVLEKLDTYRKINANFVDRNVIFAGWISGNEIIYIAEKGSQKTNYIIKYRLRDRRAVNLCELSGVISIAKVSPNGRFIVLKRLIQTSSIIPDNEIVIVDIESGNIRKFKSSSVFLDFTISPEGSSVVFEKGSRIEELFPDTGMRRELLTEKYYKDIKISGNPTLAHISPDRQKLLIINGSGGNYRAKILWTGNNGQVFINGITSLSEIFWLDNFTIAYRKGYAGNYSVVLYDLRSNKTRIILERSFNTNICYSAYPEIISFLKEQVIYLFDISKGKIINTGIEGEDIFFAPNGNQFASLLFKKLFIVNYTTLQRKRIELKRSWKSIYLLYRNLVNKKDEHENQYSRLYLNRKADIYRKLADI